MRAVIDNHSQDAGNDQENSFQSLCLQHGRHPGDVG